LEAKRFRERIEEFSSRNAVVFGISTDTPEDNKLFKKQLNLSFPLLSDLDRNVCMAYGACAFQNAYYADRVTYIIDEEGMIVKVYPHVDPGSHAAEVLASL
jgi:peroxiredoxin Q/BCP